MPLHRKGPLELIPAWSSMVPMAGRRDEMKDLLSALRSRQSRLIVGPPGIGKTRLLEECITGSGQNVVRVEQPPALHHLLVCMAGQLGCRSARFSNLVQATSVHLKPLVLDALRARPRSVIVDNLSHGDPRMHRFLQELYYIPDVNLLVTARSGDRIGHVRKLLWDPRERIIMKPLTRSESLRLFEEGCRAFNLRSLDLDDFRRKVVHSAQGNPGQILGMCRLAAESRYRCGRHIKFAPLRIDLLSAFVP